MTEKDRIDNKPLINNRIPSEKKPYEVSFHGKDKESIEYYDLGSVEKMRGLGYTVSRVIDPLREIRSVDFVPNSEVICEICNEMTEDSKARNGVHRGDYRVSYKEGESESEDKGGFAMVCIFHKPSIDDQEDENSWSWTDH